MKNKSVANRNENGVELVSKEGCSYLIPASNKDNPVINSYWKWDQAFRVYAGIFIKANPSREHELFTIFATWYNVQGTYGKESMA